MTRVRYLRTPVGPFLDMEEALDAFQREVQLSALDGSETVGDDVVDGMVVQRDLFVDVRMALRDQAAAARQAGLSHVDLEAEYPDDAVEQVLAVIHAAGAADRAAAEGELLTPPVSDEVRAVQAWVFAQVEIQLRGGPPTPWEGE